MGWHVDFVCHPRPWRRLLGYDLNGYICTVTSWMFYLFLVVLSAVFMSYLIVGLFKRKLPLSNIWEAFPSKSNIVSNDVIIEWCDANSVVGGGGGGGNKYSYEEFFSPLTSLFINIGSLFIGISISFFFYSGNISIKKCIENEANY